MKKTNTYIKKLACLMLCLAMLPLGSFSTLASTTKITTIKLRFDYEPFESGSLDDEGSVSVSLYSESAHYTITDTQITNLPKEEWKSGNVPKLLVVLESDDDYSFGSISSDSCYFYGDDADYASSSRTNSNTSLKLYVKLAEVDSDGDDDTNDGLEVSNLYWDTSSAYAKWTGASDARKYYIRLYRNGNLVDTYNSTHAYFDFSSKISSTGEYYFTVRAYDGTDYGSWEESGIFSVDSSTLNSIKSSGSGPGGSTVGAWLKDNTGWWYCNADRSYTINNWQYINNKWYYFNANGYMVTGWVYWKNIWYYCGADGDMLTNQWIYYNNYWYYLGPDGDMWVNRKTPDNYYVNQDGVWVQ